MTSPRLHEKKRLVRENDVRKDFDRTLKLVDARRDAPVGDVHDNESIGTMKSKDPTSQPSTIPPSTKKRKGTGTVGHGVLKSLESLFGDIQLNRDFYESIKKTESRCELGEDVRNVDRQAFGAALVDVENLIRVQHEKDRAGRAEDAPKEVQAIGLVGLSLDVIQFLVDMGAVTSSTATTGVTLEHSLSKSTSQHVNTSEVIESPYNLKKHPRRSTSLQDEEEDRVARVPSRQPSLVSNDPPKRQRKYDMEEVSSKRTAEGGSGAHGELGQLGGLGVADENVGVDVKEVASDDKRSQSHTHASSKRQSAIEGADTRTAIGNEGGDNERTDQRDNEKHDDDDAHGKLTWKSSLVCADLSLNEVGSNIYGPLLASLRAAGMLGDEDGDGGEYQHAKDVETFEMLMQTYAVTPEEIQELGNSIFLAVENVYVGTYNLREVNIAQKALAVVAEAFNQIAKDYLVANHDELRG